MADRPILFIAPMIRALLDGRKTQTRRILSKARVFATPERPAFTLKGEHMVRALQGATGFRHLHGDGWFWECDALEWQAPITHTGIMAHIGYAVGDRLWVKETWAPLDACTHNDPGTQALADNGFYRADDGTVGGEISKWRPSIFMTRNRSRITLIVTDVRVQRLQDCSEADAVAEGIWRDTIPDGLIPGGNTSFGFSGHSGFSTAVSAYQCLWDHINGAGAWDANPWVVAVSFDVRKGNIDG